MVKPVEENRLISGIKNAIELRALRNEIDLLRQQMHSVKLDNPEAFSEIISGSQSMFSIFRYIETVAKTSKPVLITGETGTGKEVVAKVFHNLAGKNTPFVTVNVAGLDDNLFSDTLFGHVKGSFTGAEESRKGLIEQASGGILFLDEIGDLSIASQVKLLRLLQDKTYFPIGADFPKLSNARLIAATNRNLDKLQEDGSFRKDLFYRLKTHHVHIPPLRNRINDLPLILDYFIEKFSEELGKKKPTYPKELPFLLKTYSFPGNVRELESMVFEALSHHKSKMLSMEVFRALIKNSPEKIDALEDKQQDSSALSFFVSPERFPTLKSATTMLISEALKASKGNQALAAKLLGISPQALSKRLKERKSL